LFSRLKEQDCTIKLIEDYALLYFCHLKFNTLQLSKPKYIIIGPVFRSILSHIPMILEYVIFAHLITLVTEYFCVLCVV